MLEMRNQKGASRQIEEYIHTHIPLHIYGIDFGIVYSTLLREVWGGGKAAAFAATIWKIETPTAKYIRRLRLDAVKQNIYTHKRLARGRRGMPRQLRPRGGKEILEETWEERGKRRRSSPQDMRTRH